MTLVKIDDKCGFINDKQELVIPCIYDDVSCFINSFAYVLKDGKYGFINKEGEEVISCIYDSVGNFLKVK